MSRDTGLLSSLRHRDFAYLMGAFTTSAIGSWAYSVALAVWLWIRALTEERPEVSSSGARNALADGLVYSIGVKQHARILPWTIKPVRRQALWLPFWSWSY